MTPGGRAPGPNLTATWPFRYILALLLVLGLRVFEHLAAMRPFDPDEFLNLPIYAVLLVTAFAFLTNPREPLAKNDDQSAPVAGSRRSGASVKPWMMGLIVLGVLVGVRAALHLSGVADFGSSGFMPIVPLVCIAILVSMVWSWRIR